MHGIRAIWLGVIGLVLCLGHSPGSYAASPVPRSMLVLDESAGAAAGGPFYARIIAALRASVNRDPAKQASIYVEHLDLSRFRGPAYEKALSSHLEAKYRDKPIGVIVAVGIGALQYTLRIRAELWPTVPVVFTFVDPSYIDVSTLPSHVTGTTSRLRFSDMIAAARAVVPDLDAVAVVSDPLETLVPYRNFKQEIASEAASGLEIIDVTGRRLSEVRERVSNLLPRSAIIYIILYSDGEGTFLAPVEALRRFAEVANRPIIINAETQVGQGGIGGFVSSPSALGQAAADIVLRIFGGEHASTIPISEGKFVKPIFDWNQLQRWGVSESQLPPGSEILLRPLTAWDQYRWQIIAIAVAVLLQAALIHWLLYERRQRRLSEVLARNSLSELARANRMATGSELTASIAHEVMQPLTGMVSSANAGLRWLSSSTPDIERARAMLSQVVAAGHRAGEVVRAIRAVFTNTSDNRQPVAVNDQIVTVLDLARDSLKEHRVDVDTQLDGSLSMVLADPIQLQQVFLNLIVNAIDSMSTLPPEERRLLGVQTRSEDGGICVSIDDTGPGIAPEMLDQIFKPLFTTRREGLGLGLSICRSIVEAHHGRIRAEHRQPRGLVVHVHLPVVRAEL